MSLIETLTLTAGPIIAKALLKSWLGDAGITYDLSASLIDLVKAKTSDVIAQQQAKRQFESIGEKVALSLLPIFQADSTISDEQQALVANAVSDTLNQADIKPILLAKKDLNPSLLSKYLLETGTPFQQGFSEIETALYRRIIDESSNCIIDIASQLPAFTERTFAEILKRETEILNIAQKTLDELEKIRQISEKNDPLADTSKFENEYRRTVTRKLDNLELYGADVSSASRRHQLSVAYVSLNIAQRLTEKSTSITLSAEETISRSNRLVIRGMAGSGKTTLLKWLAVRSASHSFIRPLLALNETVPFFISLRNFLTDSLPTPEKFPELLAPAISGTMPTRWTHRQLQMGRAMVLVDGIDELPSKRRNDVKEWLIDLVNAYPDSRFIITSRPSAINEGWISQARFVDAEIQPMELKDVNNFINHWHDAVKQELSENEEKKKLEPLADHLKAIVRYNRPIAYLATSPLLCALLCALHRDRNQQIPTDRIELYEACIYMLLERRDLERGIEFLDHPKLTYRQKVYLLQDVAYWMLLNGWSSIDVDKAKARIDKKLKDILGFNQNYTAENVLKYLIERSGMLRESSNSNIDFCHRTFFEYLAAQAALDAGDLGVLVKNSHDDQWQEVIILATGLASTSSRNELLNKILDRGNLDQQHKYKLNLLAVASLESSIGLQPSTIARIDNQMAGLVPPRDNAQAKALASAGDLAIPHIRPYLSRANQIGVTTSCIRALGLIGTELALDALSEYNQTTEDPLLDELLRAWDFFDRNVYATRVLSKVTTLHLTELGSLDRASHLYNLRILNKEDCSRVENLEPLRSLVNLEHLELIYCNYIKSLGPLSDLVNLVSIRMTSSEVNNLKPLARLDKLQALSIESFRYLSDLSHLSILKNLMELKLRFCPLIRNLEPVKNLTKLESIDLRGCEALRDLSPLNSLPNLTKIIVGVTNHTIDIPPKLRLKTEKLG